MIVVKAAQEQILNALQAVAGIVERRHTLPILANVLMRKTGSEIEFTTSATTSTASCLWPRVRR